MEDEVVEMPEPLGFHAKELFHRGSEYFEAFKITKDDERLKYPTYFLLVHSIELFLKSFLAAKGVTKRELKKADIRHDLEKLYERCDELGLPKVSYLRDFTREFKDKNSDHDFRYPTSFILRVPSPKLCIEVVDPLREALRPIISEVALRAQIDFAAETFHLRPRKIRFSD
ncbi:hypothetical protein [Agrobacterium larrymoorei]|uniref:HEPN domain-containing protein n=1 Tax=Agrobacterium larrymoorei TaxID=160699 RepID=A0ABU0UQT3_9HYPH|nr:hypothetical protein [Agrobacterium larrymoorei]MDQ1187113.1 hypothetical protein [Agrobacterium larrymoorei]